jgi:hypothetical protein
MTIPLFEELRGKRTGIGLPGIGPAQNLDYITLDNASQFDLNDA